MSFLWMFATMVIVGFTSLVVEARSPVRSGAEICLGATLFFVGLGAMLIAVVFP